MNKQKKIIEQIVKAVSGINPDSEVYLFGSRARGDYSKHSDWDLLVLLNSDNISFSLETSLYDRLFEVELETGEVISPIVYPKKEWNNKYIITPLYENILKEGVRIK